MSKFQKKISTLIFFYVFFFLLMSIGLGNLLINYSPLNPINTLFYIMCFLFFGVGAFLGEKIHGLSIKKISIRLVSIINICTISSLAGTVVCWLYNIKHWGSLSYILSHAMLIREKMIGGNAEFIPAIWSYLASLSYLSFIASLFLFHRSMTEKKVTLKVKLFYVFINLVFVILLDMLYFGRIGAVFSLLTLVAFVITFQPTKRILNKKNFILLCIVLILVNVPRIIRGGGDLFLASLQDKIESINVPVNVFTAGPVINYIYYFSSPYSFNQWMENGYAHVGFTYGARTLTPFYNIVQKISGDERVNIIDADAYIPFRHNVFSVVKDYYCDFGLLGVFLIPLIIGGVCGNSISAYYISEKRGRIDYSYGLLGIFLLAYILYSPLYNILSFGKFFIPLIFILLSTVIFRVK